MNKIKFVFFGSSQFSKYVLEELEASGLSPALTITSAKEPLPIEKLKEINADVFVVASFGKILPKEIIYMPRGKTLNVHPSLLPKLRGPSPIQYAILSETKTGVSIIRLDEKMDHGPLLAKQEVRIEPWPDKYETVEEKLGRAGGRLLVETLPLWIEGKITEQAQDEDEATYTKLFSKEDGEINLENNLQENLRRVLAFNVWPGAYFFFQRKDGKKIRVNILEAEDKGGKFVPKKVIPEGKREMDWQSFLRGNN